MTRILCLFSLLLFAAVATSAEEPPAPKPKADADSQFVPSLDEFVAVEVPPEVIHQEKPVYPDEARKKGIEGSVWLNAFIDTTGTPIVAKVKTTSGTPALDSAAVAAGYKNRYKPAMQSGRPVGVWVTFQTKFRLDDKKESQEE